MVDLLWILGGLSDLGALSLNLLFDYIFQGDIRFHTNIVLEIHF